MILTDENHSKVPCLSIRIMIDGNPHFKIDHVQWTDVAQKGRLWNKSSPNRDG